MYAIFINTQFLFITDSGINILILVGQFNDNVIHSKRHHYINPFF